MSDLTIEVTWVPRGTSSYPKTANRELDQEPTPPPPDDEIAAAFRRLAKVMAWG